MKKHIAFLFTILSLLWIMSARVSAQGTSTSGSASTFTVHEWGTFTTLSGSDGTLLPGLYHEEENLPSFVHSFSGFYPNTGYRGKGMPQDLLCNGVTLKMETPVIYFYSDQARTVNVKVGFPSGTISQWFPDRTAGETPIPTYTYSLDFSKTPYNGSIEWDAHIRAKSKTDSAAIYKSGETHTWQAPRNTDANNVGLSDTGGEVERYLFYRGVGNAGFMDGVTDGHLILKTHFEGDLLVITNLSSYDISHAFVWERLDDGTSKVWWSGSINASGQIGAKAPLKQDSATWQRGLTEFRDKLIAAGLYQKEADAMIDTWHQSYFETPGLRVFWIVPRASTDISLPMTITPAPTSLERVLVARSEVLTPEFEKKIQVEFAKDGGQIFANDRYFLAYQARAAQLPALGVTASATSDGGHAAPGQSSQFEVTISNNGTMDWTPGAPSITGQDVYDFRAVGNVNPAVIPASGIATLKIQFIPSRQDIETATLTFPNSTPQPLQAFSYDLTGVGAVDAVSPVSMNGTIGIYPNPTEGIMTIANIPPTALVTISDALGREQNIIAQTTAMGRQLDLSKLPSGVYLVRIEASGVRTMHQVVRE